jgi:hypothetical protein
LICRAELSQAKLEQKPADPYLRRFPGATDWTQGTGETHMEWEGKDANAQPIFTTMAINEYFLAIFKVKLISRL